MRNARSLILGLVMVFPLTGCMAIPMAVGIAASVAGTGIPIAATVRANNHDRELCRGMSLVERRGQALADRRRCDDLLARDSRHERVITPVVARGFRTCSEMVREANEVTARNEALHSAYRRGALRNSPDVQVYDITSEENSRCSREFARLPRVVR